MLSEGVVLQAADWYRRMTVGEPTLGERIEYVRWLKQSTLHVREALAVGFFFEQRPSTRVVPMAVVTPVRPTPNGVLIEAVSIPWIELVTLLERDPGSIHCLHWRMWEEIVAGAYHREGYEVELTPRSRDGDRDIIATRSDIGTIRILDQVKAFSPGRVVTADDVRAFFGTINLELNVSKGFITTTSRFAPGVYKDERLARFMPYRLELRGRDELLAWLSRVKTGR